MRLARCRATCLLAILLTGCTLATDTELVEPVNGSTDTGGNNDAQSDPSDDAEPDTSDDVRDEGSPDVSTDPVDISDGRFMTALVTPLGSENPLYAQVDVTVSGSTLDLVMVALKTDDDGAGSARPDARTPTGGSYSVTTTIGGDNHFVADFGRVTIPGDANPVTFGDIEAELTLSGGFVTIDSFCGEASGEILEPIRLSLEGSTFGGVRAEAEAFIGLEPRDFASCR